MTYTEIKEQLLKRVITGDGTEHSIQVMINILEYHFEYILQQALENPTDPTLVGEALISAIDQEIMAYEYDDNQGDDDE